MSPFFRLNIESAVSTGAERLTVKQTIAHRVLPHSRIIVVKLVLGIPAEEGQLPRALEFKPGGDRRMRFVPGLSRQLSESTDCFQSVPGEHQGIDLDNTITGLPGFRIIGEIVIWSRD
jgi:hypothetical protein